MPCLPEFNALMNRRGAQILSREAGEGDRPQGGGRGKRQPYRADLVVSVVFIVKIAQR